MITVRIILPNGKNIEAKIRDRHYRKILTVLGYVQGLSFLEKLKILFSKKLGQKITLDN